jgi:hypothetical protein
MKAHTTTKRTIMDAPTGDFQPSPTAPMRSGVCCLNGADPYDQSQRVV